jgi:hypothetical protein
MTKKKGISLNPKNKGKFTEYCQKKGFGGVTSECIKEAKASGNPTIKKRAVFAENVRTGKIGGKRKKKKNG